MLVAITVLSGAGCKEQAQAPQAPRIPSSEFEGDGIGSERAGDQSFEITSPDGAWTAYNVKIDDSTNFSSLVILGADGAKKQLALGETQWPIAFSPNSEFLLYVSNVRFSSVRHATSLFVYRLATAESVQVTNYEPDLATIPADEFEKREVGYPLAGVTWRDHTITYSTRSSGDAYEKIQLDLDTRAITRSPIPRSE